MRQALVLVQALLLLLALAPATAAAAAAAAPTERLAAYYESWAPTPPNATHPLAAVPCYVTDVILAFFQPNGTWQPGQATWDGSGLNFDAPPAAIKQAIAALKARCPHTRVLVSVGGYSFGDAWAPPAGGLNASAVAAFVQDFSGAIDGVDIDYEPPCPGCTSSPSGTVACATDATYIGIVQQLRAAVPRPLLLTAAVTGSGAYGEGAYVNAATGESLSCQQNSSSNSSSAAAPAPACPEAQQSSLGLELNMLRSAAAADLDFISIMGYDEGDLFVYADSVRSYAEVFKGPLLWGVMPPPEDWGCARITVAAMDSLIQLQRQLGLPSGRGVMLWSLQQPSDAAGPSGTLLAQEACRQMGLGGLGAGAGGSCDDPLLPAAAAAAVSAAGLT